MPDAPPDAFAFTDESCYAHTPLRSLDDRLEDALRACIASQRSAPEGAAYVPEPHAERHSSIDALTAALARGHDTSDIRTDPSLTNCLAFHTYGLPGSVVREEVTRHREAADGAVRDLLHRQLPWGRAVDVEVSGHFWYPPGSYMGWHTNQRVPGWRAYLTYAEQPGRSYFRYRHPSDGTVVTSWDGEWDLRVFRVGAPRPFWHAVYSETHRYSFGYRLVPDPSASGQ